MVPVAFACNCTSRPIPAARAVSTVVAGGVPTRIPLSNLRNTPPIRSPLGPLDPLGQLSKDRKKGNIIKQGDTVNTTHLALSEPGGAPVTADETSPLGRRRTRGLFIRQGERDRARSELTAGVEEVARAVELS